MRILRISNKLLATKRYEYKEAVFTTYSLFGNQYYDEYVLGWMHIKILFPMSV